MTLIYYCVIYFTLYYYCIPTVSALADTPLRYLDTRLVLLSLSIINNFFLYLKFRLNLSLLEDSNLLI